MPTPLTSSFSKDCSKSSSQVGRFEEGALWRQGSASYKTYMRLRGRWFVRRCRDDALMARTRHSVREAKVCCS